MYDSPIDIIYGKLQLQLESNVCKAVQQVDIKVDKEELIKALEYDRDQYEKGYRDAQESILDTIRCNIEQHRRKTQSIDTYDLVGDCLDIIDKYDAKRKE